MTITWYVDDLKISHVNSDKVTKLIDWIKVIYVSHMKEYHGKKLNYL